MMNYERRNVQNNMLCEVTFHIIHVESLDGKLDLLLLKQRVNQQSFWPICGNGELRRFRKKFECDKYAKEKLLIT